MSSGRAGSWLAAVSFLCLAGQILHLVFNCGNNMAGFLGLQPLLFRNPCSFAPGPPTLGLNGTKSCNLISGSQTKDPFSIPSSKEALHGASGSLSPPVSLPCKTHSRKWRPGRIRPCSGPSDRYLITYPLKCMRSILLHAWHTQGGGLGSG